MDFRNFNRSFWALTLVTPVLAAVSTSVSAQTWKINLRDADLTAFINEVADITGKNFAVDPRVRGNVTVISNKPLNKNEVYDLFLGVLNVNGVVAIPSGNTIRLVPDSNVKNAGVPYDSRKNAYGDQVVTRVIWLENTNPNDLIPALRPLMPQFAHLAAIQGTNAIIVSDRATNIYQLETLIRNLDGTGQNDVEAVALQSSQAEEVIALLETMSSTGSSKEMTGSRVRIVADARTNRILIKGDPGTRKRIRQMIEMLDIPSADRLGGMKVFKLKYASAKNLSQILQGLVTGQNVGSNNDSNSSDSVSNSNTNTNQNINTNGNNGSTSSNISTPSINLNGTNRNNQNNISSFNGNGVSIIADNAQNALVVKADPQLMREIESAIQQLDIRREQVLIEAAIIEVAGNDADQLGVQWALGDISSGIGLVNFSNVGVSLANLIGGFLANGSTGAANAVASSPNGSGTSVLVGDYKQGANGSRKVYGALIQALKTNTKSNLLSTPSIVTLDNEEAYIVVGQNVPFVTGSVSTTGGNNNPYTSVERKDVGVTLKVIPHVGEGGSIRLEVEQEVSAVQDKGQATDLVTSKRAIKTSVLADHGQTVVLGGLISDNSARSRESVPGLGSIPGIGRLFRADNKSHDKRNLLVFIHPTIIGDSADVRRLAQQKYDRLYSLQLSMDKDGSFSKLPADVEDVYQPRLNITSPLKAPAKPTEYKVPEQPQIKFNPPASVEEEVYQPKLNITSSIKEPAKPTEYKIPEQPLQIQSENAVNEPVAKDSVVVAKPSYEPKVEVQKTKNTVITITTRSLAQ